MSSQVSHGSGNVPSVSPADTCTGRAGSLPLSSSTPELMSVSPINIPSQTSIYNKTLDGALKRREWLQSQKKQLQTQILAVQLGTCIYLSFVLMAVLYCY